MNALPSPSHRRAWLAAAALTLLGTTACPGDDTGDTTTADTSTTALTNGSTGSTSDSGSDSDSAGSSSGDETGPGTTGDSTGDSSGDPGTSTGTMGLEIAGTWLEDIGGGDAILHAVDEAQWATSSPFGDALYHVETYDNDARWVVAQGDAGNEFFPELYNKFNWHWDGDTLFYCTAAYDAATAEDAMAAPDADPGDLMVGCGGFPWSLLEPEG